ncbi:MAG TPA: hypothetical protein VFU31_22690 [Candidatus Binatia bacterium]|nr:hypothetical protein [Candidatus Binatia bacterium]
MKFEELWILRGNEPVLWTVPFFLCWEKPDIEATLYCSLDMPTFMRDAADSVLLNCARPYNGMWRILKEDLERVAYRVDPPVNAHLYLSWERRKEYQKPEHHPEMVIDLNDFIDALYQRGVGKSRDEVAYWWRQFCNHMLDWLIMKEKPVDLGFLKLHPTHYRPNWKPLLLSRFPKLGIALHKLTGIDMKYILQTSGLLEALTGMDILAMHRERHYLYRNVEIELGKTWYRAARDVELARRRRLGPILYAQHSMDSIRRGLPAMLRIYRQWLARIARPSVKDIPVGSRSRFRMVPNLRPANPAYALSLAALYPVVPNKMPEYQPASLDKSVFAKAEDMQALPGLQPSASQLREHPGDVSESGDWQI